MVQDGSAAPTAKHPAGASKLTPQEIELLIHEIARHGDGADRRWALSKLEPGDLSITLPPPLTEDEIVRRVARILIGVGFDTAKRSFGYAFPGGVPIAWKEARDGLKYAPENLRELYELFPEAEKEVKTGAPPGYPTEKGVLAKRRWIAKYALGLNAKRREQEDHARGKDATGPPESGQQLEA